MKDCKLIPVARGRDGNRNNLKIKIKKGIESKIYLLRQIYFTLYFFILFLLPYLILVVGFSLILLFIEYMVRHLFLYYEQSLFFLIVRGEWSEKTKDAQKQGCGRARRPYIFAPLLTDYKIK